MIALPKLQNHIKKRVVPSTFCTLLALLSGCQNKDSSIKLSKYLDKLSESMNTFTSSENLAFKERNHFQAKILEISRMNNSKTAFFYYKIILAPRTTSVKKINSVTFMPVDKIVSYFKEKSASAVSLKEANYIFTQVNYPELHGIEDYTAYEYDFILTNINNDFQNKKAIPNHQLDDYMRNITIEIGY